VVLVSSCFRHLAIAPKVHWQAGAAAPARVPTNHPPMHCVSRRHGTRGSTASRTPPHPAEERPQLDRALYVILVAFYRVSGSQP
jgi:hypothetical protein